MTKRRGFGRMQEPPLLHGQPADSALARLLADAAAPAHPQELEGLSAALAAFSANRPDPRRSPVKSLLAKLVAAKALAAAAGALSLGGVALAASTGSLPPAAQNATHHLFDAPAASSHHAGGGSTSPDGTTTTVTDQTTGRPSDRPSESASPTPSLVGLCRAYGAGVATAQGRSLDNPAFTVLVTAAGGKDAVAAYCTTLLAAAPGGGPTALPTQAQGHRPTSHPTGAPTSHPAGTPATQAQSHRPTSHPTGAPTSHPTGRP